MSFDVVDACVGQLILPRPVLDDGANLVVVDVVPVETELAETVSREDIIYQSRRISCLYLFTMISTCTVMVGIWMSRS